MVSAILIEQHPGGQSVIDVSNLHSLKAVAAALRWLGQSTGSQLLAQASCRRRADGTWHLRASARPVRAQQAA